MIDYGLPDESSDLSSSEKRLVEVLGERTMSVNDLMSEMGLSSRSYFRKHYLHPALEHGLIEMTVPDKTNSQLQKYRKK